MHCFPAHIRVQCNDNKEVVQSVAEHSRNTAEYAGQSLKEAYLFSTAYLAGLLHDCGKFTGVFEEYLRKAVFEGSVQRGTVNHTFAGVRFLLTHYHTNQDGWDDLTAELLAYAVGAHHGLFDLADPQQKAGFQHRLEAPDIREAEAFRNFYVQCAGKDELNVRFRASVHELKPIVVRMQKLAKGNPERLDFYLGLLARLILSAVIEGDRRDTAEFMTQIHRPSFPENRKALWEHCLYTVEEKLREFPQDTPVQCARAKISAICRSQSEKKSGVYRLNVPTGSGKALASLRYALAHGAQYGKKRILFVMPLLSIIEQNSKVIRDFVQDPSLILEHHSNVVCPEENTEALDLQELLEESWQAPVIITTLVQLLNTLFSGKTSAIRRFQALCDSILVIDEVQTVPCNMLSLFNLAVNFLSEVCGATVVLCSATQPCLEEARHPLANAPEDMVPHDAALWAPFRRTKLEDAGSCPLESIPQIVLDVLDESRSLLVVCNKKGEAERLYRMLSQSVPACFHLSAAMCMAHRRDMLRGLEEALRSKTEKVVCVSTQVIEAGVDISFERVIRLTAGMDSVVQSAGRCNRNGESAGTAPVYLLRCADETMTHLPDIRRAQSATEELLAEYRQSPERFESDLFSDEAIRYYYRRLYRNQPEKYQDFLIPELKDSLLALLSSNRGLSTEQSRRFILQQAFRTAGEKFKVFDSETTDVLVPYEKGKEIIAELCSSRALKDLSYEKALLERAQPYTVSLFQYQRAALETAGALTALCGGAILALNEDYYHEITGLTMNPEASGFLEVAKCDIPIL